MSASHIASHRNSTPEGSSSLRPPNARSSLGAGHHLRASADMSGFSSPLANRGIRPASEIYFGRQNTQSGNPDEMERAAQQWLADIDQYETTLEEMATATMDQDFKDELSAIEQWFRVLSEAERTAALYALLQQTTQVQIRFFIQVLQQMSKSLPMSGVLSPANFGEKDPMTQKLSDAMSKLSTGENRHSMVGRPPPSPGAGKRNSTLDTSTIHRMFPDAAAAIAKQKADFTEHIGMPPASNRNSTVIDRNSMIAPTISAPDENSKRDNAPPASPWNEGPSVNRPKSSGQQHAPMGQFTAPPPSAGGLRSPRLPLQSDSSNVQTTTLNALEANSTAMPLLSPAYAGGSWASQLSTPMVANFNQAPNQADMVANATAMKLAALSTVNNRIQLDDVRKFRRDRSSDAPGAGNAPLSPGLPHMGNANLLMTNDLGQVLTPQQAAMLQAQQLAVMNGQRSRPNSPGLAMHGQGMGGMGNFTSPQNNGFLAAGYGGNGLMNNGMGAMNMNQFAMGMGNDSQYMSDNGEINRGRSPRGRRGSSKPPEDPTDPTLLQDIPNWLRSLRLHKYTDNLKDMKWQDLVELDDEGLEKRGVNALGARRKMLKVFEQVQEAKNDGKLR
ncbi:hypothetical protein P153DRAFT_290218 [Dothidotthia symphoricarpi CBS 119687]|uniref:RNA-binding protein VTS1 n=1 Tax=Dothidotthia symphoricarpi CBS 119687 TaxID=1392245 RepID=A0A6A6AE20_9PLEO|nr:uncharacterized protein P153DRAFT_290218 [Dothidotthia symphoricarpi CBS 119687]KAF2130040.1 hypothetical protein P153DRAFT_290218 [Dothidotthia symphoricarpi CBS 119687]